MSSIANRTFNAILITAISISVTMAPGYAAAPITSETSQTATTSNFTNDSEVSGTSGQENTSEQFLSHNGGIDSSSEENDANNNTDNDYTPPGWDKEEWDELNEVIEDAEQDWPQDEEMKLKVELEDGTIVDIEFDEDEAQWNVDYGDEERTVPALRKEDDTSDEDENDYTPPGWDKEEWDELNEVIEDAEQDWPQDEEMKLKVELEDGTIVDIEFDEDEAQWNVDYGDEERTVPALKKVDDATDEDEDDEVEE